MHITAKALRPGKIVVTYTCSDIFVMKITFIDFNQSP